MDFVRDTITYAIVVGLIVTMAIVTGAMGLSIITVMRALIDSAPLPGETMVGAAAIGLLLLIGAAIAGIKRLFNKLF